MCGSNAPLAGIQGRCAYVPRLPLLILSPFAKVNFVDHDRTDQSSIIRFVETIGNSAGWAEVHSMNSPVRLAAVLISNIRTRRRSSSIPIRANRRGDPICPS
jgi:hypothetical protein